MTHFSSKLTKDKEFWRFFGETDSLLPMTDEHKHKERFKLVASLFSPEGVRRFEPQIRNNVSEFLVVYRIWLKRN